MKKAFGGKALAVVAVAGGALIASIAPAMAEVSAQSPSNLALEIQSPATTEVRGAVLKVKVKVTCPAGESTSVDLQVTEAVAGGRIAFGSGNAFVDCTGDPQIVTATLTARDNAFRRGIAYAKGSMCVPMVGCARDERQISITS